MAVVNERFLKWKVLYFLMIGSLGPYVYFVVDFYRKLGLTFAMAGYLEAIVPFFGCVFGPVACYLADRFALHRILLSSTMLIYAVSLAGFVLLSTFHGIIVGDANNYTGATLNSQNETCLFVSGSSTTTGITNQTSSDSSVVVILFCLRFLSTLGIAPATSLIDGIVYHDLERHQESTSWGRQRLWGSVGYSLLALTSAFLLDYFGEVNGAIGFSLALGSASICFIVSVIAVENYHTAGSNTPSINKDQMKNKSLVDTEKSTTGSYFLTVTKFIFTDGHILLTLMVATGLGYFLAARDIYVSKYLEIISRGSAKKIMGVMQIIVCCLEIPSMFCVKWFLRTFGTLPLFATCFASFSFRFFAYTLLTAETVWFFLLIEVLHVFSFALVVPALTLHAHRRVVKYQSKLPVVTTVVQGLISALYTGLGYGIGCISGGLLTDGYGYHSCMHIFSITAAAFLVLFCIIWVLMAIGRKSSRTSRNCDVSGNVLCISTL